MPNGGSSEFDKLERHNLSVVPEYDSRLTVHENRINAAAADAIRQEVYKDLIRTYCIDPINFVSARRSAGYYG